MNEEEKARKIEFEELAEMFATKGWKRFIQYAKDYEKIIHDSSVDNAVTNDQWQYCRGQLHELRSYIAYESYIRAIHEQQELEDADTV